MNMRAHDGSMRCIIRPVDRYPSYQYFYINKENKPMPMMTAPVIFDRSPELFLVLLTPQISPVKPSSICLLH